MAETTVECARCGQETTVERPSLLPLCAPCRELIERQLTEGKFLG